MRSPSPDGTEAKSAEPSRDLRARQLEDFWLAAILIHHLAPDEALEGLIVDLTILNAREYKSLPLPACPTRTMPNTPDRDEVYRERKRRGEALHHPDDLRVEFVDGVGWVIDGDPDNGSLTKIDLEAHGHDEEGND